MRWKKTGEEGLLTVEAKNYMVQEETVFSREKLEEQVSLLNCAKKENQIAPENAYVSFNGT